MSLLFDQNLSRRLVGLLAAEYPGAKHVEGAGLLGADDQTVWHYAAGQGLMVVSKDSDFRNLALLHGPPPKVIWLQVGNGPTAARRGPSSRERENPMAKKPAYEIGSGNVFADLGVPNPEVALVKADLAAQICRLIAERRWTPARAAKRLGIRLADLTQLQRGGHERLAIEQLRQFLGALLPDRTTRNPARLRTAGRTTSV